jgi:hypothetical protein
MAHFCAYVLIPRNREDTLQVLVQLLDSYSQDRDVEPYETECYCVRHRAGGKASELCSDEHGSIESVKAEFEKLMAHKHDVERELEWARLMKQRDEQIEARVKMLLPTVSPDPDCKECGGKGIVTSTYNENVKLDWWMLGGRYSPGRLEEQYSH